MKSRHPQYAAACAVGALILCATGTTRATEGGGSTYNPGVENFLVGAAPPPGFYVLEYVTHYRANDLINNSGTSYVPGFSLRATAAATRLIWSTDTRMAGGNLVLHTILPLVDLKVSIPGVFSQRKSGLGDITFGPGIAFHHSPQLHSVAAVDFVAPTGRYRASDPVNVGRNYWSVQPLYAMSYVNPTGFNGDFKATLNLNGKNSDTNYHSGDEFIVDYSLGWGFGNGWTLGAGGYWYQQINDDKVNGVRVADRKARGFAIGPSLKYDNGKGWFITAKLQQEVSARNRPEGAALWIKTSIPF